MRPRSSLVFAVAVITAAVALPERRAPSQTPATENTGARPNVVVIVTDDQRADTLDVMPKTRAFLGDGGITFPQTFVATPLCCPSRASIMTGRYAHNHGVRHNRLTPELDHTTTMQAALKTAGYQTAISGKFLLYWDMSQPPPNFDHWAIVNETDYYGDYYDVDGERQQVDEYSTDYIAAKALEFLDGFEADDTRPFFLYIATQAPHQPFIPEPDYESAPVPEWQPSPSVYEDDRSDKPSFVSVHRHGEAQGRKERDAQLRTLYSVDDGSIAFREYYDLQADPYEMENLLADADPANDPDVTVRSARLAQLATCAGRAENGAPNPCP